MTMRITASMLTLTGILFGSCFPSFAQNIDSAARVENADPALRPLTSCIWNKSRSAAMQLSAQYQAGAMQSATALEGQIQYKLSPSSFAACGATAAILLAVKDPGAFAGDLNNIRVNRAARCVYASDPKRWSKAIGSLLKSNARIVGSRSGGRRLDLVRIFMSGKSLPEPILSAVSKCDAQLTAYLDFNGATRAAFVEELDFEAKKNA